MKVIERMESGSDFGGQLPIYTDVTLRDLFGAFARAGIASASHREGAGDDEVFARWAYRYADAMLAARKPEENA